MFTTGWQKSALGLMEGPNCLVGAVLQTEKDLYNGAVFDTLVRHLDCNLRGFRSSVYELECFNDQEETTFDDIVAIIDRTVKHLENIE